MPVMHPWERLIKQLELTARQVAHCMGKPYDQIVSDNVRALAMLNLRPILHYKALCSMLSHVVVEYHLQKRDNEHKANGHKAHEVIR